MPKVSISKWRSRAIALAGAGALLAGAVGTTGLALATTTAPAGAQPTTTAVSLTYVCSTNFAGIVSLTGLDIAATLDVTAPTSVTSGSTFTVDATSTLTLPTSLVSTLSSLASTLGITGVSVTQVSADVDATGATPATQTDSAEGLPFNFTVAQLTSNTPVSATLEPLTYTAGSPGTATFTAGDLDVTAVIEGGSLAGDSAPLTCTSATTNPPLGTITVTQSTITAPAPVVSSISPTSGPTAGGTSVTITGSGFTGATGVSFGTVAATSFTVGSDTSITAVSPAGTAGPVDVTVTGPGGTSATSSADQFTYQAPANVPTVSGIFFKTGTTDGYTLVFIFGTNFTGTTGVDFGTNAALYYAFSSTLILSLSPPTSAPGTVDVTVTTPAGTSATSSADQFTYTSPTPPAAPPTVTRVSPPFGSTSGGTTVTITGTNLTGATAVKFGSTAATAFTVNSATSITATSPAGTGTVDVTVTTPGGTSATSSADHFTYYRF